MNNQYVILTGSKNNAGDFLIKYRAKQLFAQLRPDRNIVDINAWVPFGNAELKEVNQSKALILMGGPSLQKDMRSKVYPLVDNLDEISVPIITMGIGWKSRSGKWLDCYNYPLSKATEELLDRVNNSGYLSSVRDFQSKKVLSVHGFKNFLMTGCPAYYDYSKLNTPFEVSKIKKISYSLGVSFVESKSMERLMKENILQCRDYFQNEQFEVVFHHSLSEDNLKSSSSYIHQHYQKHKDFASWLQQNSIQFIDISGSAENLMQYYSQTDLHIGFRVHAHIFMNSISKASILLSEDGRAEGVRGSIGGIVIGGYKNFSDSTMSKLFNKLFSGYDRYYSNKYSTSEILDEFEYEKRSGFTRLKNSRKMIDGNFEVMTSFINQLP